MQTIKDSLADTLSSQLRSTSAANEDFAVGAGVEQPERPRVGGWDPYEVWRTRIKAIQDSPVQDAE
jgi:hypothetical protein